MTDPSLLQACQDAPWDMVARGIYADWLDEHGEPETAAKFRDPHDGPTLLSLLPEPVWHPPICVQTGVYELPLHHFVIPLSENLCVSIQAIRARNRGAGAPIESETLEKNTLPSRTPGNETWFLTWKREGWPRPVYVTQNPEPRGRSANCVILDDEMAAMPPASTFGDSIISTMMATHAATVMHRAD